MDKCVRKTELTARLGGEEFGVLIPHCKPEEAAVIARRICTTFEETEIWTGEGERIAATVSIGAAYAEIAPPELTGLLATADLALYRAKAAGRNRVELSWPAATNGPPVLARRA
jgi:diguanylate cyclase (GGDEF)-like protein